MEKLISNLCFSYPTIFQHCFFNAVRVPRGLVQFQDICLAIDLLYQYAVYQFAFYDKKCACMWYAKPVSCGNCFHMHIAQAHRCMENMILKTLKGMRVHRVDGQKI